MSQIASAIRSQGRLAYLKGEFAAAWTHYTESLAGYRDLGDKQGMARCLAGLGNLMARQGQPERAARLWGAATAVCEEFGAVMTRPERRDFDGLLVATQAVLGDTAFAAAWARGGAMTPEQAVAPDS